jgi:hypothetical protein
MMAKTIRSGTAFEIECPIGIKEIPNIRTYALVLNNAQKNMEINIYGKNKSSSSQEILNDETYSSFNVSTSLH